ncbi:MAG: hypothetical protein AN484_27560, partial [Aphanizomenon flos-aquae WA102]
IRRIESELSFVQVKASMSTRARMQQVKNEICANRRQIAYSRLEAVAGAENPYSLIQIFGRGHLIVKAGAAMYVTHCSPVDVLPRTGTNCTEEIPVRWNNTDLYVDPISFVIQSAGTISRCNDIAPSRFQIAGRWYCMFPEMRECGAPEELPVQAVKIDEGKTTGLGLGRSIYTEDQIQAFVDFQDAHQVRRAYLAETAEIAYAGRGPNGEWGHGLGGLASASVVSLVGSHLIPL